MLSANIIRFIFLSATVVYIAGLFVDVINVDAAQYASISKEMLQSGSYLTVKHCGRDYLDKPPLLFWLSALMFKIFGFYNWAYKLPSLLFTFLGVYATYRLARSLYDINVARLAALILYTCQAFFMFNNDVRTDTILTACVITSIWLLYEYTETEKMKHFFGGSLFIALGLMAKGPLGIVVPSLALGIHFILKREWKHIFKPIWLLMLLLVLILLLPMCIGLYKQFGAEGIRFFFWTQSFGRITGENEWRNDAGYFYFVHTFLWSFIPWSVLAVYALGDSIRAYIKRRSLPEYISIGGFMLTFAALSLSKYKLPHYIFVVYPLAAIFTAAVFDSQIMYHKKTERILKLFHHVIFFVLLSLTFLSFYVFQIENLWVPTAAVALFSVAFYFYKLKLYDGLIVHISIAAITFNLIMNVHFYPQLLNYQPGKKAASILLNKAAEDEVYYYENKSAAFDFYYRSNVTWFDADKYKNRKGKRNGIWIYSETDGFPETLKEWNLEPVEKYEFDLYPVKFLNIDFLNPKTRNTVLKKAYLVRI